MLQEAATAPGLLIREKVAPKRSGGRVLLWWDFFSIAQKAAEIHTAVKGAQILAIPFYLAAAAESR